MNQGLGFGYRDGNKQTGKPLKVERKNKIQRFLFARFQDEDLLIGLYKAAAGERYLFKKDLITELKAIGIFGEDGEIDDEARDILLETIILQPDGSITLEIG